MAHCALAHVQSLGGVLLILGSSVLRQSAGPGHVVGIDVEYPGLRIRRRAAPLRPAVESGEYYGVFPDAERDELSVAAKIAEPIQGPLMCAGCALAQKIFGEQLPREGRGLRGQALLLRGSFAGNIAGGIVPACDWKQRLPVRAFKEKDETLLRGLGDRVHLSSVVFYGQKHGR